MNEGCQAKRRKYYVHPPLDVTEARRREEGEGEVACPVEESRKRDCLAADVERDDLGWIEPGYWPPCCGVGSDEQVRTGDYRFAGCMIVDDPGDTTYAIETSGYCVPV